jgi:hypothetical protein
VRSSVKREYKCSKKRSRLRNKMRISVDDTSKRAIITE